MKQITIDGNEAVAESAYLFSELAGIYPITPSSPMAERIDEWSSQNRLNIFNDKVKVVEMQSEAGASGLVHGSLQAGCLTSTFTASQGLLLMIPNMYKIAGEMLPGVFHVAARALSTHALSIFGDHQDVMAARATGFCMLASESVQAAHDLALVSHMSAIDGSLPFMHFFDGFRTSHEISKIRVLEKSDINDFIPYDKINEFRKRALNPNTPHTIGTAENDDVYFQRTESRNKYYDAMPDIVNKYMSNINKIANTDYKPFNYYGDPLATKIIVAMGSICETIKEVIDDLNSKGEHLGLVTVHLYRPFSKEYLLSVIPDTVKSVAVLDRTKEAGSNGEPLYLDVKNVLSNLNVVGGRYGLSSKNTTVSDIAAVYEMLDKPINNFTIGINDDVTNLSLTTNKNYKISNSNELMIYGYGSDGMVSASKAIIKLIGNNSNNYVQGYFEYDSKKSGGVTISHLRFASNPIRSEYYCENPELIVVSKQGYLDKFDCLSKIKQNGTFIINTEMNPQEFVSSLSIENYNILKEKNVNVYTINALKLAYEVGLRNRISTIMESAIMSLFNVIDYDLAKTKMIDYAEHAYFKKGPEIFEANKKAILESSSNLVKIDLDAYTTTKEKSFTINDKYDAINHRLGNDLPVSAFTPDGIEHTSSFRDKRGASDSVPNWIPENCIMCNQCSLECPHGVITPFLLSNEEYNASPEYVQKRCIRPIEPALKESYYYCLAVSVKDCTGCGICVKNCPGKMGNKALTFNDLNESIKNDYQNVADYLFNNIKDKKLINNNTIKGCQFAEPKFAFSGACAGCGETPYLKLLTQLFGDDLMISNATGCSSIYGASSPSMPYSVPWASSLFEDNAEYGYGILMANNVLRHRVSNIMELNMDNKNKELFELWLSNPDNYETCLKVYNELDYSTCPKDLVELKEYIKTKSVWTIGGDGWAYDIGYSGIDHVLASNDNVNILVLDTEVYSNTGGQSSKSSHVGSIAAFTSSGKKVAKKDLARIAMSYDNVYVAQTSLGANPMQTIKCMKEAAAHQGPSIIIAYCPCISHGIAGGMTNSYDQYKLASNCGYFPTFRRSPSSGFALDSKTVNFDLYDEFLNSQTRYKMLSSINPEAAQTLLKQNKENAMKRYQYYVDLQNTKE